MLDKNKIVMNKERLLNYLAESGAISRNDSIREIPSLCEHLNITRDEIESLCSLLSDAGLIKYTRMAGTWETGGRIAAIWLTNEGFEKATEKGSKVTEIEEKKPAPAVLLPGYFFLLAMLLSVILSFLVYLVTHDIFGMSIIFLVAILLFLLLGGFYLRLQGKLSEKNLLQLIGIVIKQIPLLFKAKNE
jgi:positive regulator of sigma E activity